MQYSLLLTVVDLKINYGELTFAAVAFRNLVNQLRRWEKETYSVTKLLQEDGQNEAIKNQLKQLDNQVFPL